MEYALAAALLGDLVICRRIFVDEITKNVLPVLYDPRYDSRYLPAPYGLTELEDRIISRIWSRSPHATVRDWLEELGPFALEEVPLRLAELDFLKYDGLFLAKRWRPVDHLKAIMPLSSLEYAIRHPDAYQGEHADTLVLGLIEATFLTDDLFYRRHHPNLREYIRTYLHQLPADFEPSINTIIATVQHVVGNAVFTHV